MHQALRIAHLSRHPPGAATNRSSESMVSMSRTDAQLMSIFAVGLLPCRTQPTKSCP
jgi:hypothetical protein